MHEIARFVGHLLGIGIDPKDLSIAQMALRSVIVYALGILIVRIGPCRSFGRLSPFDTLLGFVLGSVLSRAINGSAGFVETICASLCLVLLHWVVAWFGYTSKWFGYLVKGEPLRLVDHGVAERKAMRRSSISFDDVMESLRLRGLVEDPGQIERAYVERSGEISVVLKEKRPKVLEISVVDGVQTVRIQLDQ